MPLSALDLFTIGIGPSSSHTVGPMRAANRFVHALASSGQLPLVARLLCQLYGSLAATGKGHRTGPAILLGYLGELPESVAVDAIPGKLATIRDGKLALLGKHIIPFDEAHDLDFTHVKPLPLHPNGMRFTALDHQGDPITEATFYSLGGGFIATEEELSSKPATPETHPHPFTNAVELMAIADQEGLPISGVILANEAALRPEKETRSRLDAIWLAMQDCVRRGCQQQGILPGGLKVRRRAHEIHQKLLAAKDTTPPDPLTVLDWVNLYALAVNEENAAGARVVTAPTNGAAGIIPAVLHYAVNFRAPATPDAVHRFLLTSAAIGMLYKRNASISGAEAGCQGEVGVACSMAAAGLVEYLGGSIRQVENAAEIGMEHNLGLTCDPVGGLVQIPCIERNAMGAVKAINAARLAMAGDGTHFVSLDKVIKTMRDTGRDMKAKYKETSRGGLAVNVVEC
jgi:L-serine dehydratase